MVREFLSCGEKRYRATVLLKAFSDIYESTGEDSSIDDVLGLEKPGDRRPSLPESLKKLDYSLPERVEEEIDSLVKENSYVKT
jgi:hypothetical protein